MSSKPICKQSYSSELRSTLIGICLKADLEEHRYSTQNMLTMAVIYNRTLTASASSQGKLIKNALSCL